MLAPLPPDDKRSRVVVVPFLNATGKREMGSVGRDAANYVRAALPLDKYDIVDASLTERAMRGSTDPVSLGWTMRADYVVSGVVMQRGDSVALLTQFRDVRDGRFARADENTGTSSEAGKLFAGSLAHVNSWLDSAKVMRARRPNGPPGGPRGMPMGTPQAQRGRGEPPPGT
jgi:TolB-like protein